MFFLTLQLCAVTLLVDNDVVLKLFYFDDKLACLYVCCNSFAQPNLVKFKLFKLFLLHYSCCIYFFASVCLVRFGPCLRQKINLLVAFDISLLSVLVLVLFLEVFEVWCD